MTDGLVQGKVALVTGAASGIGRATAVALAREGAAAVVVADVDRPGGEETVRLVEAAGAVGDLAMLDVTRSDQVAGVVEAVVATHGRLDLAHNNAGTTGAMAPTADYPEEEWHRVVSLNLTGVFLCMKHELAQMSRQGSGAIVNTSSGAGVVGFPGLSAYVASKHGVLGLTKSAAMEYAASGVRVNAVCPGSVRTPMLEGFLGGNAELEAQLARAAPLRRLGTPEEVAEAVVWLCSDRAALIVGHSLLVDGGAVAR